MDKNGNSRYLYWVPHICGSDIVGSLEEEYLAIPRGSRVLSYPGIANDCHNCKYGSETYVEIFQ